MPKFILLWTDVVIAALVVFTLLYAWRASRNADRRRTWSRALREAPAMCSAIVLALFLVVALSDSVHFRRALPGAEGAAVVYATRTESLLDVFLARQYEMREASYSRPLAYEGLAKQSVERGGAIERAYPRLMFGGAHLPQNAPQASWAADVSARALRGALFAALGSALVCALAIGIRARSHGIGFAQSAREVLRNHTEMPVRAALLTVCAFALFFGPMLALMDHYHVFGTDRTGNDVLLQALKSIRTAFVIGTLATLATLPFAIVFGVIAGYFKGWVDDLIQYLYTTLSSVPNVLLIAACVLMVQVFIDKHPEFFATAAERADVRLLLLCLILGVTGWASLCRLVRAETLKIRELDYVQAATAFGSGAVRIMVRHVLPNVMHLVLITTVLEFSALILYEAVLSYVGVGVDPSMNSFGGMINLARTEMSRDPLVWWPFVAAFGFMVTLVLAANLFADGVRDAFDPRASGLRARAFRNRRARVAAPVADKAGA
ncbi:MAG TPA: ABC transporter permease [Burkholderiaceae bacterium]|jgi:peptide/nickel transport system permease protein|nr:ABC transporter permease [Burkholderiaceae bacterium]